MHLCIAALVTVSTVAAHTAYLLFPAGRVAEEVFYVMRGVEGVFIFGALAYFAFRPTVARVPTGLLFCTCVFGAYQESLTAICGLPAIGDRINAKPIVDAADGLCGAVTGIPWTLAEACLILLFILTVLVMYDGKRNRRRADCNR